MIGLCIVFVLRDLCQSSTSLSNEAWNVLIKSKTICVGKKRFLENFLKVVLCHNKVRNKR